MVQAADIELAGAGYMVLPGTYKRTQDGPAEGRNARVRIADFLGGQGRALQLEKDRGWDAQGIGPALGGQGIEPWPNSTTYTDAMTDQPSTTSRAHSIIAPGASSGLPCAYVGVGRRLYRSVDITNGTWANFTIAADLGAGITITGLALFQDDVMIFCGAPAVIRKWRTDTNALVNPWQGGEEGVVGVGYRGGLVWATGQLNDRHQIRTVNTRWDGQLKFIKFWADSPVVNMGLFAGAVVVATEASLMIFDADWNESDAGSGGAGAVWSDVPHGLFSHGTYADQLNGDFVFLLGYRGRLWTWLGGQVVSYQPDGSGAGWRRNGPVGAKCYGGCVAGGYLLVTLTNRSGNSEVWAFDGAGWYRTHVDATGSVTRVWPVAVAGAGNRDALLFRSASASYDLHRLLWRSTTLHTYSTTGYYLSSLLDGGERDREKAWRKVGAIFASPQVEGNPGSSDQLTVTLSFSSDGGANFTAAGSLTNINDPATRTRAIEAAISTVTSRWLQLKLEWTSVSDWAPVLVGLFAEYELLTSPAPRRKWMFTIDARDGQILRDASKQARSGRQLIADLWAAWQAGATVTFRDQDYDADATQRNVRIVGIAESVAKTSDAGRWGDSQLALTLVEV
jgi:hypothetical protein